MDLRRAGNLRQKVWTRVQRSASGGTVRPRPGSQKVNLKECWEAESPAIHSNRQAWPCENSVGDRLIPGLHATVSGGTEARPCAQSPRNRESFSGRSLDNRRKSLPQQTRWPRELNSNSHFGGSVTRSNRTVRISGQRQRRVVGPDGLPNRRLWFGSPRPNRPIPREIARYFGLQRAPGRIPRETQTEWRWGESVANPSLLGFPDLRESTGNSTDSGRLSTEWA